MKSVESISRINWKLEIFATKHYYYFFFFTYVGKDKPKSNPRYDLVQCCLPILISTSTDVFHPLVQTGPVSSSHGPHDISQLVATHPKLTTLKAAVEAAGLQDTLASTGQ